MGWVVRGGGDGGQCRWGGGVKGSENGVGGGRGWWE